MTLDAIFMPRPQPVEGRRVEPLGEWPRMPTKEEREARRRESFRRYAERNRAKRMAAVRAWRAARKAA